MKLVDLLKEIGDATARPYSWEQIEDEEDFKQYVFQTDSETPYDMTIVVMEGDKERDSALVNFGVMKSYTPDGETYGDYYVDYDTTTNKGELYKVMATVVDILKDFIKNNQEVKYIQFDTTKGKEKDSNIRVDLYTRYIQKHLPNAKVQTDSNRGHESTVIQLKELNVPKSKDAYKFVNIEKHVEDGQPTYIYTFKNSKGQLLDISNLVVDLEENGKEMFIAFGLAGIESDSYEQDILKYGIKTSSGDMFKVMATVVDAIRRTMKQEGGEDQFSMIKFSSSDEKRDRIYSYYIKSLFPKFRKGLNQDGRFTVYVNQDFKTQP